MGEVGFELENGSIVPKSFGKDLTNKDVLYIENVGAKQLRSEAFRIELLGKVEEALNSGQFPAGSNRVKKFQEMIKILTPPIQQ